LAISLDMLVWGYSHGIFPMADSRNGQIDWYSPDPRAVLPIEQFKAPRSLQRRVGKGQYHHTQDQAFEQVIEACAQPRHYEKDTWINRQIIDAYISLHQAGMAHSIESWSDQEHSELVGGLYGVSLGGAFFGESMFSRATDASKCCLVYLVQHLRERGFMLLDTQFSTTHLEQFGVVDISREQYLRRLEIALRQKTLW